MSLAMAVLGQYHIKITGGKANFQQRPLDTLVKALAWQKVLSDRDPPVKSEIVKPDALGRNRKPSASQIKAAKKLITDDMIALAKRDIANCHQH